MKSFNEDLPHGVRMFKDFQAVLDRCPDEERKKWYLAPYTSNDAPVIIGGCGRSGTSLLRSIINAHSDFFCGPETAFMYPLVGEKETLIRKYAWLLEIPEHWIREAWNVSSQAMFVDVLFASICVCKGKRRWAEKTPKNVMTLKWIFDHWPNAYFIHVIRDGRDVICSLREHPKWKIVNGKRVRSGARQPLKPCVERWVLETSEGLKYRDHPRYIPLHYEDLIFCTEDRVKTLCSQLNTYFDPGMLDEKKRVEDLNRDPQGAGIGQPINRQSAYRWKKDLTEEELAFIYSTPAKKLLKHLGYIIELDT